MKNLFTLTEYNLRAIKKPLVWMLALMGPAQFGIMLGGAALLGGALYAPPSALFYYGMVVPAACMVAAAALNFLAVARQNGRAKAIYTLMTLPTSRSHIYLAGVLSGAVAVWAVMAAQALWYMLLYAPTALANNALSDWIIQQRVSAGLLSAAPTGLDGRIDNGLFLSMLRAPAMRLLFPTSARGLVAMAVTVVCPVACLQAVLCRRGAPRILHIALFLASTLVALAYLGITFLLFGQTINAASAVHTIWLGCLALQLALGGIACVSALYGVQRAKNL